MKTVQNTVALNTAVLKKVTHIALSLIALSCAGHVAAESTTGNASVTIQETLTFTENQAIAFGSISDADGTCSMNSTGVLSGQCLGQPNGTPGQLTVSGTAGQAVNISVGSGSVVDGVTLTPVLNSNATATLDGSGEAVIDVSADLTLVNATGGTKALTYVVTVNYN